VGVSSFWHLLAIDCYNTYSNNILCFFDVSVTRKRSTTRRKKRGRSRAKTLIITRQKIGRVMTIVAFLYFFSYFFAPDAPLMSVLYNNTAFAFGKVGVLPFFVVTGVT
jgi:hypothetical protein